MPPKFGGFGSAPATNFNWQQEGGSRNAPGLPSGPGSWSLSKASAGQEGQAEVTTPDPDIEGLPGEGLPFPEAPLHGWVRPDQQPDTPLQSQEVPVELATGDHVVIRRLKRNPQLNGLTGVVDEPLSDGRWRVVLDGDPPMGDKSLKAVNLQKVEKKAAKASAEDSNQPSKSAPSAGRRKRRTPTKSACPPPPPGTAIKAILKSGRPDWKDKDLNSAQEKLEKIGIKTGFDLLLAVRVNSGADLNMRLKGVGEKAFAASTMNAFANPALADPKSDKNARSAQMFPSFKFEVIHDMANVRSDHNLSSRAVASKTRGEIIPACVESFDGWIRLDGEPGWIMKDMKGMFGVGALVSPIGKPTVQAFEGPFLYETELFEVVYKHVAVRAAPLRHANMLQLKMKGEKVLATFQTYDGWIYIPEQDGWMLSSDAQLGQLLRQLEPDSDEEDDEVMDAETFAG